MGSVHERTKGVTDSRNGGTRMATPGRVGRNSKQDTSNLLISPLSAGEEVNAC